MTPARGRRPVSRSIFCCVDAQRSLSWLIVHSIEPAGAWGIAASVMPFFQQLSSLLFESRSPQSPSASDLVSIVAKVRGAVFGLLHKRTGLPIGCGVFVSDCGIGLTNTHDVDEWSEKRGEDRVVHACRIDQHNVERALTFRIVYQDATSDFCIMELESCEGSFPPQHYPIPTAELPDEALWGKNACLVHGNVAFNRYLDSRPEASVGECFIPTVHPDSVLYTAHTSADDSGGAMLLLGTDLIGFHVRGKRFETSASVAGLAVRLDCEAVRAAVERAVLSTKARRAEAAGTTVAAAGMTEWSEK
jgi:hypothetical protein